MRAHSCMSPEQLLLRQVIMAALLSEVHNARGALQSLLHALSNDSGEKDFDEAISGIRSLLDTLARQFDQPRRAGRKRLSLSEAATNVAKVRRSLRYQSCMRQKVEDELAKERAFKMGRRIQALWLVRVCVAKPTLPARTVESFCRDFPLEETRQISHTQISHVRDA